jgi:anti-sigma-K factor RskA
MKLLRPDLHTLTGVYAVDAIDGTERDRFERHLDRCQSCDQEVRGLQETATRLGVAAARTPPPGMKAAVLAAAAQAHQHPPVTDAGPATARRTAARPERARAVRRPRLAIAVASVASAVVIALGVLFGIQRGELDQARAQQRAVAAVLNSPDARIVTERTQVGGTATVVVARSLRKLIFTSRGLPALAGSRVYQLWLISPAGAVSAGLLPGASGGKTAPVLASGLVRGDQVGVTVEPAGGTKQPTTKPIVLIGLGA